ncbi:MAG: hypothetical protein AAGE03_10855 [Pseudomonadota bacterium]
MGLLFNLRRSAARTPDIATAKVVLVPSPPLMASDDGIATIPPRAA